MKIVMLIFMVFVIGALYIISENNLALNNKENIDLFGSMYGNWISSSFQDAVKITGRAIEMKWLPEQQDIDNQYIFID